MKKILFPLGIAASVLACVPGDIKKSNQDPPPYFNLKGYFAKEVKRLGSEKPELLKVVAKDGEEERRMVRIKDWQRELDFFIASDINKSDWYDLYRIEETDSTLMYTAIDSSLRTRQVEIRTSESKGEVKHISIWNRDKNQLYQSEERLDYIPDKQYNIRKDQFVRFLGESHYTVSGIFQ